MDYKDYYKILGLERNASEDEVRKAYRKLAMQYHPDRNPNDKQAEERFKEINEAYQVLNDPKKRAHYDKFGNDYANWQGRGAPGDFNWDQYGGFPGGVRVEYGDIDDLFGGDAGGFSDFFRTLFGRGAEAAGTGTRSSLAFNDPPPTARRRKWRLGRRSDRWSEWRYPVFVTAGTALAGELLWLRLCLLEHEWCESDRRRQP